MCLTEKTFSHKGEYTTCDVIGEAQNRRALSRIYCSREVLNDPSQFPFYTLKIKMVPLFLYKNSLSVTFSSRLWWCLGYIFYFDPNLLFRAERRTPSDLEGLVTSNIWLPGHERYTV